MKPARSTLLATSSLVALLLVACSPAAPTAPPATTPGPAASGAATLPDLATWKPAAWSDAQAARLVQLVIDATTRLGFGGAYAAGSIVTPGGHAISLGDLAAAVDGQPESGWPAILEDRLRTALGLPPSAAAAQSSGAPVPAAWSDAQPALRVIVRAADYFKSPDAVTRDLPGGLREGLVVEKPSSFTVVPRKVFDQWGVTDDQAFGIALANTLADPGIVIDRDESDAIVSATSSAYSSSYVLAPDRLFATPSPNGAIVGVPTRDSVVAMPIRKAAVRQAIQEYPKLLRDEFAGAKYPVSPVLFWWRDGSLTPISDASGKLTIPPALQAILDSLGS